MTAKERTEILAAGNQMVMALRRLDYAFAQSGQRATAAIARERWEAAYAAYRKRTAKTKTKRA